MPMDAPPICPSEIILSVVKGRWAPKIVATLATHGSIHFLALGRAVPGISKKVLSDQLRFFQEAGIVKRSPAPESSEVAYALTPRGRALKEAMDGLNDLAARWHSL